MKISHKAFGYANICYREGDPKKAKKNLVHSVRYLMLGIQLAEHGKIIDYTVANSHFNALLNDTTTTTTTTTTREEVEKEKEKEEENEWKPLRRKYKKINKELHYELENLLPNKKKGQGAIMRKQRWAMRRKEKMGRTNSVPKGDEGELYVRELIESCKQTDGVVGTDGERASNLILFYLVISNVKTK